MIGRSERRRIPRASVLLIGFCKPLKDEGLSCLPRGGVVVEVQDLWVEEGNDLVSECMEGEFDDPLHGKVDEIEIWPPRLQSIPVTPQEEIEIEYVARLSLRPASERLDLLFDRGRRRVVLYYGSSQSVRGNDPIGNYLHRTPRIG